MFYFINFPLALRLVCCQLKCSSSGEYVAISNKLAKIVIPDRSIAQPYEPEIEIPSVCNVDRTCSALVLEVEDQESKLLEKHIWAPNTDHMHYFKLNRNESGTPSVTYGPNLYASNCFKFFHIENHRMGALCIERVHDEDLIVPYKILYNEQGELQDNQLGIQIHLNMENHSPFIVLNSTREFEVIGISYFEHLSLYKLFVIHYNAESSDIIDVPSNCTGPHDLQPIQQSDAIIRCADGKVLYFSVWDLTFSVLTHNNIEIISTCTNTTSFVLVQGMDDIIIFSHGKSGVIYQLAVNTSGRPLRIVSAVCHALNEDEITYYFADAISGAIYKLYLGDVVTASSRQAMIPQTVRDGINSDGVMISLYIDGPILWGRLTSPNHSDVTVYITDLLTMKQSLPVPVNGPNAFVQLYTAEKCERTEEPPTEPPKAENSSNGPFIDDMGHVVLIVLVVVIIIVLLVIIVIAVFIVHRRRHRKRPRPSM